MVLKIKLIKNFTAKIKKILVILMRYYIFFVILQKKYS
jgi:hypothetical protein